MGGGSRAHHASPVPFTMQRAYRNPASDTNRPGRTRRRSVGGSYIAAYAKEEFLRGVPAESGRISPLPHFSAHASRIDTAYAGR